MAPQMEDLEDNCRVSLYYYGSSVNSDEKSVLLPIASSLEMETSSNDHVPDSSSSANENSESMDSWIGLDLSPNEKESCKNTRRGRPRSSMISDLIQDGLNSTSPIKCYFCSRIFPRRKSLQTHLRIHDGAKPFVCTFPGCVRMFVQSGQRKTHFRLHAGDKPFICTSEGCSVRFTHPNRRCKIHPDSSLERVQMPEEECRIHYEDPLQAAWLKNYYETRPVEPKPEAPEPVGEAVSPEADVSENLDNDPQPCSSTDMQHENLSSLKDSECINIASPKKPGDHGKHVTSNYSKKRRLYSDDLDKENNCISVISSNPLNMENNLQAESIGDIKRSGKQNCVDQTVNKQIFHDITNPKKVQENSDKIKNGAPVIKVSYASLRDPEINAAIILLEFSGRSVVHV